MGILPHTFRQSLPKALIVLHLFVHTESDGSNCIKKKACVLSSHPAWFLTSTHLANYCVKWKLWVRGFSCCFTIWQALQLMYMGGGRLIKDTLEICFTGKKWLCLEIWSRPVRTYRCGRACSQSTWSAQSNETTWWRHNKSSKWNDEIIHIL